jgi:hypothetical protein
MSVFLNPLENKKHKTISILTLEDIKLTRSGSPPNKDIIENFLYNVLVSLSNISTSSSEEEICNMMNEIKNDLINPYKQEKWCNNNINRIIYKDYIEQTFAELYRKIILPNSNDYQTYLLSLSYKTQDIFKEIIHNDKTFNLFNLFIEFIPFKYIGLSFEESMNDDDEQTIESYIDDIILYIQQYLLEHNEIKYMNNKRKDFIISNFINIFKNMLLLCKNKVYNTYNLNNNNTKTILDNDFINKTMDYFNVNIYFIDYKTKLPSNRIIEYTENYKKSIVLLDFQNHFETIGILDKNSYIIREFLNSHKLIDYINNNLITKQKTT